MHRGPEPSVCEEVDAESPAEVPLYEDSPGDAALDVGLSHALLRDAADRGLEALRVWIPPPALSFGRLDLLSPRRDDAIVVARESGLQPVRRLAGGRAAAIGPGTVCVGWAVPSPEMSGMQRRYETLAGVIVAALARLGVAARVGELPGEWCPGAWSLLVGGVHTGEIDGAEVKVGGLAQRVIKGGAWAEAVVVVSCDAAQLAGALDRVQRALDVAWDPATLGHLSAAAAGVTPALVREALIGRLSASRPLRRASLTPAIWSRAEDLRRLHELDTR